MDILENENENENAFIIYIEQKLQENDTSCIITGFTRCNLDGIQTQIYIQRIGNVYNYKIISHYFRFLNKFINNSDEIVLLEKHNFVNVRMLLEDIQNVKKTYKILKTKLLSPEGRALLSSDFTCSICYEPTMEYTLCKHYICFQCREKCVCKNILTCPICRHIGLDIFPIFPYLDTETNKILPTLWKTDKPYLNYNTETDKTFFYIIDNVKVYICIRNHKLYYTYFIISNTNMYLHDAYFKQFNGYSLILLEKDDKFKSLFELQKDIQDVKENYRFMEHKLLSPKEMEFAILQREYWTLSNEEICSICKNVTNEYTICKHFICFKCREKRLQTKKRCPVCKAKNLHLYPTEFNRYSPFIMINKMIEK
jgi:hypothetical protein